MSEVMDSAYYVFAAWLEKPEYGLHALPRLFEALRMADPDRYTQVLTDYVEGRS